MLLKQHDNDTEQVIAYLLDHSLPPRPHSADGSKALPQPSSLPCNDPATTQTLQCQPAFAFG